jgi:hypothetical protein
MQYKAMLFTRWSGEEKFLPHSQDPLCDLHCVPLDLASLGALRAHIPTYGAVMPPSFKGRTLPDKCSHRHSSRQEHPIQTLEPEK